MSEKDLGQAVACDEVDMSEFIGRLPDTSQDDRGIHELAPHIKSIPQVLGKRDVFVFRGLKEPWADALLKAFDNYDVPGKPGMKYNVRVSHEVNVQACRGIDVDYRVEIRESW